MGSGGVGTGGNGAGGQDGSGGAASGSDGCGMVAGQATGSWQSSSVSTGGGSRPYDTWLPNGYDPASAYPVILLLHGCTSGTNNVPMEGQAGSDAILVRGTGSAENTCWNTDTDGPDMDFVDAMIADVQDRFCVNPDHLFAVGYSSGSWLASRLSCNRGDVFRGIATVTGGEPGGISGCSGQVGRMFVHDSNDNDNLVEWDTPSRDRMIDANNCSTSTMAVDPSPCVQYEGCDPGYPVVWCQTSGQGHSRQDGLAAPAFWDFFQDLMAQ